MEENSPKLAESRDEKFRMFDEYDHDMQFRRIWDSVRIERGVRYSLFTFGDSDLPYYLVTEPTEHDQMVKVRKGQITVSRARIITPDSMRPEFENFFEETEDANYASFLMARTAAFSNLKLTNQNSADEIVTDTVEEAVDRLNARLDAEEEDRVAILVAPAGLSGLALLKYATQRITSSASDNLSELRERGFLP